MVMRGIGHGAFAVDDTWRINEKTDAKQNNRSKNDNCRPSAKQYFDNMVAEPETIPACSYGEAVPWRQHQREWNQDWKCEKCGFQVFGWRLQCPRCGHWWQEEDDQYVDEVAKQTVEEKTRKIPRRRTLELPCSTRAPSVW